MTYERIHICDTVIDDESSGPRGLDVTVEVDNLGAVILSLGSSMTIRTSDQGAMEIQHLLSDALDKLRGVAQMDVQRTLVKPESHVPGEQELGNDPVKW
jgi:hypothetical protein